MIGDEWLTLSSPPRTGYDIILLDHRFGFRQNALNHERRTKSQRLAVKY